MSKIIVPFTVAEDDINLLDTASYTIADLEATALVRVPVRLELHRAAGTAYAIGARTEGQVQRPFGSNTVRPPLAHPSLNWGAQRAGEFLVVRDSRVTNLEPIFYIPLDDFLLSPDEKGIVVFPNLNSRAFKPGETSYEIRSPFEISGGTGAITGRLFFDEFSVA